MREHTHASDWNPAAVAIAEDAELDPRSPISRLGALLDGDPEMLTEDDGSGMGAATGRIGGTRVVAFCSDAAVQGGAMSARGCDAVVAAYDRALAEGMPVVGLWHSGGARLREGVESLDGVGRVFTAMTRASGKVPQISVVLGPAAGGAAYGPALTDIVIQAPEGRVFVTGPAVVQSVTGQSVTAEQLGGPEAHGRRSGVVHRVADSEEAALADARRLVQLLSSQAGLGSTVDVDLGRLLPESSRTAYNVRPLVTELLDRASVVELHEKWAPNIVTVLGRLGGRTIGVIANNPIRLGGCLDALSAEKAARFVRMCDAFGVPLVVLVDVPGYLPGIDQELGGVVRRGAKLLHAFAEAQVPRITVVTRKAYGGAYIAMNSRSLGATKVFAWPGAEIAVMGPVAAVRILHRRRLHEVGDDEKRTQLEVELAAEHQHDTGGIDRAIQLGVVDEVIDPSQTRSALIMALGGSERTRGQHGNIPL